MQFFSGLIIGMLTSMFFILIVTFFRASIEKRIKIIETVVSGAGPKPKGIVFMPEDEGDIARREHIAENNKRGKDTPISELQNE